MRWEWDLTLALSCWNITELSEAKELSMPLSCCELSKVVRKQKDLAVYLEIENWVSWSKEDCCFVFCFVWSVWRLLFWAKKIVAVFCLIYCEDLLLACCLNWSERLNLSFVLWVFGLRIENQGRPDCYLRVSEHPWVKEYIFVLLFCLKVSKENCLCKWRIIVRLIVLLYYRKRRRLLNVICYIGEGS